MTQPLGMNQEQASLLMALNPVTHSEYNVWIFSFVISISDVW